MGRQSNIVGAIAGLAAIASVCQAQPQGQGPRGARPVFRRPPPQQQHFRPTVERWQALSPEDRQIFRRNAERWIQMTPQERALMREREVLRRERLKRAAEDALRDAGLRLDQEKRNLFEQRYLQERRKIERELNLETETKRKQQLPALNERLKKEFQDTTTSPATTTGPAVSASPKK